MEEVESVLVSVCVQTFQHRNFIAQCLDSILQQKTAFTYEIIVGEDESNDGTREICKEYALRHSDKIRLFLRSQKDVIRIDGKPTGRYNLIENFKAARGKYIAICEGDDFWTNPNKLQMQADFLEENPVFSWSFHDALELNDITAEYKPFTNQRLPDTFEIEDVIRRSGGFFHTASIMFVRKAVTDLPSFFSDIRASDWALLLLAGAIGKGKYHRECMSVYRVHGGGIFSSIKRNHMERVKAYRSDLKLLTRFNTHTQWRLAFVIGLRKLDIYKKIFWRLVRNVTRH